MFGVRCRTFVQPEFSRGTCGIGIRGGEEKDYQCRPDRNPSPVHNQYLFFSVLVLRALFSRGVLQLSVEGKAGSGAIRK